MAVGQGNLPPPPTPAVAAAVSGNLVDNTGSIAKGSGAVPQ